SGTARLSKHFEWRYSPRSELADPDKAIKTLKETLSEAVESHLVADVPIGSFLSGGIDSTVIAGLAQQNRKRQQDSINTYTVRFWTKEHDESGRARAIANDLGTKHVEVDGQEIPFDREFIDKLVSGLGEPFVNASSLAVYLLSQQVRTHVKVALSGD